ncbi:sulfatase [Hirschia litorea]|uniref:Sulfatase n=1 Tax=Hirschia litorea TaxID=1199156 RepID=A0ABW2IQ74_9PROT
MSAWSLAGAVMTCCVLASGGCAPTSTDSSITEMKRAAQEKQPNIVVLFADDLAWMDLGHYSDFIETPNLDKLRLESTSFERAYAAAPVCSPSRVGMITGQHPARHEFFRHVGAGDKSQFDKNGRTIDAYHMLDTDPAHMPSRNWLPLEAVTVAERLKDVGYNTSFVGKWHIGHEPYYPIKQGFDEQFGVTNDGHPGKGYYPPYFRHNPAKTYGDAPKDKFLTDRITDDAVQVLERLSAKEEPFFLNLWYYGVHKPIDGRKDLIEKYKQRGISQEQAEYASMVEALDESVGRISAKLDALGLRDDTILVFTSDQGGFFDRAPLKGRKTDGLALFEGGARVPMFVRWPQHYPAGKEIKTPVTTLDVAPTILAPAHANLDDLDGVKLAAHLGEDLDRPQPVIMYRHYEDLYAAVVVGDMKLLASVSGKHQLYNVVTDISEAHDLAREQPETVADMLAILEAWKDKNHIKRFAQAQN